MFLVMPIFGDHLCQLLFRIRSLKFAMCIILWFLIYQVCAISMIHPYTFLQFSSSFCRSNSSQNRVRVVCVIQFRLFVIKVMIFSFYYGPLHIIREHGVTNLNDTNNPSLFYNEFDWQKDN